MEKDAEISQCHWELCLVDGLNSQAKQERGDEVLPF